MAFKQSPRRNEKNVKLSQSTVNFERAAELSDSMYQVLCVESKYSMFTNQQFAMSIEMLVNRLCQTKSPEARVYINAIIRGGLEGPCKTLQELGGNQPINLTNKLEKRCKKEQKPASNPELK